MTKQRPLNHPFRAQYSPSMERLNRWVIGVTPLPKRYYFDDNCINNHAINGKVVRYVNGGKCIQCRRKAVNKYIAKKDARDMTALHDYEDKQLVGEIDPLFDD